MSFLVCKLLDEYYDRLKIDSKAQEKKIIEEVKESMAKEEERTKIEEFLNSPDFDLVEYQLGVKENKWRSSVEFARLKLGL